MMGHMGHIDDRRSRSAGAPGEDEKTPEKEEDHQNEGDDANGGERFHSKKIDWSILQNKLFGREEEFSALLEVYQRKIVEASSNREIVIITGKSGTGKTRLARMLGPTAQKDECYFLSGKCDQMIQEKEPEPFGPFVSAFTQFVQVVVSQRKHDINRVAKAMEVATKESDITVLTDMIPALETLIRPRSEGRLQYLETSEEMKKESLSTKKTRPNSESPSIVVFCKFVEALCSAEHPVVLHIDDWQWLESSSLALINALAVAENIAGFLLIGTCRGDEVSFDHPLSVVLRNLDEQLINIVDITVENLPAEVVNEMICELLDIGPKKAQQLALVTHSMTNGNAFFVEQFLRTLEEKGLLYYKHGWCLDERAILDNELSLSSKRMLSLAVENLSVQSSVVKEIMQIGSLLGSEFSRRHILVVASGTSSSPLISQALESLVERGLLYFQRERHVYQWTHDRFQQAAFLLIPENHRAEFQMLVGSKLLDGLQTDELQQHPFVVANLLFKNADTIESQEERNRVAGVFLSAGEKAAQSSSFDSAVAYFQKGIDLLPVDRWSSQYDLSLYLYNGCAEMECCLGRFQEVEELLSVVLEEAKSFPDKLRAYETQLFSLSARSHMHDAIKLGFEVLNMLGEPFPRKPKLVYSIVEILRTKAALRRWSTVDILGLRPLRSWSKAAALRIIQLIFPNVLRVQPEYAVLITTRCIRITLKYGLSPMSSPAFASFGMILAHPVHDIEAAARAGDIAMKLQEKFDTSEVRCRLYAMYYSYVRPWTANVRLCMPSLLEAGESGLLTGDVELAFISYFLHSMDAILLGFQLQTQLQRMKKWQEKFTPLQQDTVMFYLKICQQLVRNLTGEAKDPNVLISDVFDEKKALQDVKATKNTFGHACLRICTLFLATYLSNTRKAAELAAICRKSNLDMVTGTTLKHVLFYSGLADISYAIESGKKSKKAGKREVSLLRKWAVHYPKDLSNKILFLEAERCVMEGHKSEAIEKYLLAIEEASHLGAINEEALACERFARALQRWDRNHEAIPLLEKARDLYVSWGCKVGADKIETILSKSR